MRKNVVAAFMAVVASGMMMISCATQTKTPNYKELAGEWKVVQIKGEAVETSEEKPFIGFDMKEHRMYGNTGCNLMNMVLDTIQLAKGEIVLDRVAVTRRMCMNDTVERRMLSAFSEVKEFGINKESKLELRDANKKVVILLSK